jgi:hypothetical protein
LSEQSGVEREESVSGELGERVRALVAAAEGMAAAVRSDADSYAEARRREADTEAERRLREASEQADGLLAERLARISELSDGILERAEGVARALGEAAAQMSAELGQVRGQRSEVIEPQPEAPDTRPPTRDTPEEDDHPMADEVRPLRPPSEAAPRPLRSVARAHVPRSAAETRLEDARLVALQMAVAGRTRDEVSAHLRAAFEVEDPEPILDHVFAEGFPSRPPARD